ncbi:unnamed protein product [Symbiodinium natans]|uniref:Phytanoyl-CoA dioxygenase n=1 Tax=Symbiodinium natans TaxID=878477 RepID=A0A812VBI3_9DINO|nr:unnamed protein product [Symbiodinium natans]
MGRYTFGRLHLLLRGSPEYEPAAVSPHASLAPLVYKHFELQDIAGRRVFLSEAQLVIADPFAETQQWHMDAATGRGLSVFLPLSHVAPDRGPQEVLPGFRSLCATHGAVQSVAGEQVWSAGDALVMDAGLLHRGLPNDSLGAPVPMLVLRYDLVDKPPPGCRRSWLLTMSQVGRSLSSVFRLYAWM